MNLIAYSDSEESDTEVLQTPKPAVKPALKSFQKVVDRSNPGKIKLSLPSASQSRVDQDDIEADAPPTKKARTGGGAFSGFNAMLPAPKKPKVDPATAGMAIGNRGTGKKLGVGINLRTGAEPAFQRRTVIEEDYDEEGNPIHKEVAAPTQKDGTPLQKEDFRALLNLPPPKTESEKLPTVIPEAIEEAKVEVAPPPPTAKPASRPKFMPLSVTRGKKKKPAVAKIGFAEPTATVPASNLSATSSALVAAPMPVAKPKVSLFGVSQEEEVVPKGSTSGHYQPLLYGFGEEEEEETPIPDDTFDTEPASQSIPPVAAPIGASGSLHNLTNIASELNLTEAERRQLFGRRGRGPDLSSANIIDFNTDQEYAHNERLREQGETMQHNVLKSITGTGKNSLKSLINVATTQKDALEDHFAAGKRNKREAGNKYGW